MPAVFLNIGLEVRGGNNAVGLNRVSKVLEVVEAWLPIDVRLRKVACVESHTEPTLFVQLDAGDLAEASEVYIFACNVAKYLGQDCIAVYHPGSGYGALVGARASDWGAFNSERFFLADGLTLAQHLARRGV